MNIFDPNDWADPTGFVALVVVMSATVVGVVLKMISGDWEDWLDERWGRGSIRDWWLLNRVEQDANDRTHRAYRSTASVAPHRPRQPPN